MYYAFRPWLRQALRDLDSADKSREQGDSVMCSMLARLASEKALKAFYVSQHGHVPDGSGSVSELIRLMGLDDLDRLMHETESTTAYMRPADRSLSLARNIVGWVKGRLE